MATRSQSIPPSRIMAAVESAEAPVVTAADVASEIGCCADAAADRLDQLTERGCLASKDIHGERVWFSAVTA